MAKEHGLCRTGRRTAQNSRMASEYPSNGGEGAYLLFAIKKSFLVCYLQIVGVTPSGERHGSGSGLPLPATGCSVSSCPISMRPDDILSSLGCSRGTLLTA